MAHKKKILVLESEKLLAAGIVRLLASRSEFDVTTDAARCLACLEHPENPVPDAVILDEELLAANISAVVKLADRHPHLRLIVFRLSDNTVHIFDKHMVQITQSSDFLDLL